MVAEIFFAWSLSTDQSKLNALLEPLFRVALEFKALLL